MRQIIENSVAALGKQAGISQMIPFVDDIALLGARMIPGGKRPVTDKPVKPKVKKAGLLSSAANLSMKALHNPAVSTGLSATGLGLSAVGLKMTMDQNKAVQNPISNSMPKPMMFPKKASDLPVRQKVRETATRLDTPLRNVAVGSGLGAASYGLARAGKIKGAVGAALAGGGLVYRGITKDHKAVKQNIAVQRATQGYY